MTYDLIIRGADVVDGTGLPPYRADVGVVGDRIAKIGRISGRGHREIPAEGYTVTPGFVDGHTHMDAQIFWDPLGTCSSWNGVTSVVMGNCGFTIAPASADQRSLVLRNLERAEDISAAAMEAGIEWRWDTFRSYLDVLDSLPKGINYAANIGHSALRTWVMGERAFDGSATESDMEAMKKELKDALRAGAIGFTTSRTFNHLTSDGRPVASRMAEWSEVEELVGVLASEGVGVFELAHEAASISTDGLIRGEYHNRLKSLAVQTGVPITFGLLDFGLGREVWESHLELIDATALQGGRMFAQSHTRPNCVLLSFASRLPFDSLPLWSEIRRLPKDQQIAELTDADVRKRLVYEAGHGDYGLRVGAEARRPDFNKILVLERMVGTNPTVAEMAARERKDPVELMIDLAVQTDFAQFFTQILANADEVALEAILSHPRTVPTFSDSGAHVAQIMDASLQTHLLADWVRDRQRFTFEAAIRMITLVPATLWGLSDRGLVREGMVADMNVLDPAAVLPDLPTLAFDLPAGAVRLVQKTSGIRSTVVGGEVLFVDGEHTGALPGRLLRGPLGNDRPDSSPR
jgi:N-acyl-D-amino-acid deacylase